MCGKMCNFAHKIEKNMHRILLSIGFCCISLVVNAINGRLFSSELLASSSVTDICQDNYGSIWIATDYGLSRFDGYHFTNYTFGQLFYMICRTSHKKTVSLQHTWQGVVKELRL